MKLKIHPAHAALIGIVIVCLSLGYCTARVHAEENTVAWNLLVGELGGNDPQEVNVSRLVAAMLAAMESHPEQRIFLVRTSIRIACKHKSFPKNAVYMVLLNAVETYPERAAEWAQEAARYCPESRAADKVILTVNEEYPETPAGTPAFLGNPPTTGVYSPVTPIHNR